jgi:hypothetical protein
MDEPPKPIPEIEGDCAKSKCDCAEFFYQVVFMNFGGVDHLTYKSEYMPDNSLAVKELYTPEFKAIMVRPYVPTYAFFGASGNTRPIKS